MEKKINVANEEKAIDSMINLLDFNGKIEIEIRRVIEKIGFKEFFIVIDLLNFTDDVKEKIKILKEVGDKYEK